MKSVVAKLLVIAGFTILVGLILAGAGYALGGMKPVSLRSNGPIVIESGAALKEVDEKWTKVTSVTFDTQVVSLRFEEGEAFTLKGSYDSGLVELVISQSESSGELTVKDRKIGDFGDFNLGFMGIDHNYNELVFTYPKGSKFNDVAVKSSVGAFSVADLTAKSLDVDLSLGAFSARDISVQSLDVNLSLGGCDIDGLAVSGSATIDISNGSATFLDSKVNDIKVVNNMGSVEYSGELTGAASFDLSMGSITLDLSNSEKDLGLDLKADMGGVTVNNRDYSSSLRETVNSPKCQLKVRASMGSVDISTR